MNNNDTNKWSDGLPFVQFSKNAPYHEVHMEPCLTLSQKEVQHLLCLAGKSHILKSKKLVQLIALHTVITKRSTPQLNKAVKARG